MAYRLDLPLHAALSNVHPVSHVSLLRQWHSNRLHRIAPPVDVDDKLVYEVHRIKAYYMHHDDLQFLILFIGYKSSKDKWLSASYLENAG